MKYVLALLIPFFISINLGGSGEGPGTAGLLVLGFHEKDPKMSPHIGSDYVHLYSFEL